MTYMWRFAIYIYICVCMYVYSLCMCVLLLSNLYKHNKYYYYTQILVIFHINISNIRVYWSYYSASETYDWSQPKCLKIMLRRFTYSDSDSEKSDHSCEKRSHHSLSLSLYTHTISGQQSFESITGITQYAEGRCGPKVLLWALWMFIHLNTDPTSPS